MEKIKILVVGPPLERVGGVSTHINNLLDMPLGENCEMTNFEISRWKGVYKKIGLTNVFHFVSIFFNYVIYLLKNHPQIVHLNPSFEFVSFWRDSFICIISKLLKIKVIMQIHGISKSFLQKNLTVTLYKKLVYKIFDYVERIIVSCDLEKKSLEKFTLEEKICIMPHIVITEKFTSEIEPFNDNRIRILFASRLIKEKGIYELLECIPFVVRKNPNTSFIIAGDGPEREFIKDFIRQKEISENIMFAGLLIGMNMIRTLMTSDIFVLPAYSEGLPYIILEALAAGLPIIATPVGAIPTVIVNGENGFLIPPQNCKALAEKINFLIDNPALRESMRTNNLKKARLYDINMVSKIYRKIYTELVIPY